MLPETLDCRLVDLIEHSYPLRLAFADDVVFLLAGTAAQPLLDYQWTRAAPQGWDRQPEN